MQANPHPSQEQRKSEGNEICELNEETPRIVERLEAASQAEENPAYFWATGN